VKILGLAIAPPHRGTWRDGICFEWGDQGMSPPYQPNVGFLRIYLQRRART
jgi:hypothetical protein